MPATRATLLCHYRYDALDRLIDHGLTDTPPLQRFYCKSRLTTEIQGALRQTLFQQGDWILAQQTQQGIEHDTALLATDLQRSVLNTLKTNQAQPIAYAPYGHRRFISGWLSLMGFNGERPDPLTGHYLLGNGYRAFNPVLMRFNSPDSLSPFGKGGLNAYAYCFGDPINWIDPTGKTPLTMNLNIKMANKTLSWLSRARTKLNAPTLATPSKYTHFAYHGTSEQQLPSLLNGLDQRFINKNGGQRLGEGFYTTTNFDEAVRYARFAASSENSTPAVIKVYVKDIKKIPRKTPDQNTISMENIINPPIITDKTVHLFQPRLYPKLKLVAFENPAWVSDYQTIGRRHPRVNAYQIRKP
ncbi:RHS repeat-associated core domain-containing protein [Pseudomonas moorei]|uniref:RHS repeat-associated core domain-containing protein n=1 Tax=Pseudomonas moorei TaxID=395599 RepID=UPI00200F4778|nr:RHS repeat-associated core domain-containing protein [Pseudomonas moorei]